MPIPTAKISIMRIWSVAPARLTREAAAYALAARKPGERQVRSLIFGQGRTGSTLLESLIAAGGDFASYEELVGQAGSRVKYPLRYIEGHARLLRDRHFIAHVKPDHLVEDRRKVGRPEIDERSFLKQLDERGYRIIYLRRRNIIRRFLSVLVARHRQEYFKFDDSPDTTKVQVDRDELERRIRMGEELRRRELAALHGIAYHEVVYEDDLEAAECHQRTGDAVRAFLGVPPAPVATRLKRINVRPMSEIVANYAELVAWATEFGRAEDLQERPT